MPAGPIAYFRERRGSCQDDGKSWSSWRFAASSHQPSLENIGGKRPSASLLGRNTNSVRRHSLLALCAGRGGVRQADSSMLIAHQGGIASTLVGFTTN